MLIYLIVKKKKETFEVFTQSNVQCCSEQRFVKQRSVKQCSVKQRSQEPCSYNDDTINKEKKQVLTTRYRFILEEKTIHHIQDLAQFLWDSGIMYPMRVDSKDYTIVPYQLVDPSVRDELRKMLNKEWGDGNLYTEEYITKKWFGPNVMYVMTSSDKTIPIGCVAIDKHNFYPYISHLYVNEVYRSLGCGSILLKIAEYHAKSLNINIGKLICNEVMCAFYVRNGWIVENKVDEVNWCMSKDFVDYTKLSC